MPTPARRNLTIYPGAVFDRRFCYRLKDGSPFDFSQYFIRLTARVNDSDANVAIQFHEKADVNYVGSSASTALFIRNYGAEGMFDVFTIANVTNQLVTNGITRANYVLELVPCVATRLTGYTNLAFSASMWDSGASAEGVILATGGTPFADAAAGDYVRITKSAYRVNPSSWFYEKYSNNDGTYKIKTVDSDNQVTLTSPIQGSDNATDTYAELYLIDMTDATASQKPQHTVRLLQGSIIVEGHPKAEVETTEDPTGLS